MIATARHLVHLVERGVLALEVIAKHREEVEVALQCARQEADSRLSSAEFFQKRVEGLERRNAELEQKINPKPSKTKW